MEYAIQADDLKKSYDLYDRPSDRLLEALSVSGRKRSRRFEALKGVSFAIRKGECVGVIGLNGSGKSTLLKLLSGVSSPTEGSICLQGRCEALLELGAGFRPEDTGLHNLRLHLQMRGFTGKEIREKLPGILEFADIGDFIRQPVRTYSSGMFVRLAFAAAIGYEPEILLIDEALSVGDVFFQKKCYERLMQLREQATILMVSHDLEAVTRFCQRTLVLQHGVLVFDGDTREAVSAFYKIRQRTPQTAAQLPALRNQEMRTPEDGALSGAMEIRLTAYRWSISGMAFAGECTSGDLFEVELLARTERPEEHLITGFQILDRMGHEIFGETSLTSGCPGKCFALPRGISRISYRFFWPEIREGDYFITLGIGQGSEVLRQKEQCWINQAIHVHSSPGNKVIYGIFNREMLDFCSVPGGAADVREPEGRGQ